MSSSKNKLSDHHYHLAVAAGHGTTLGQMQAAWNALGRPTPPNALGVVIANALSVKKTPLVEFLSSLGAMSDPGVVLDVWTRAIGSFNKPLMDQLINHPEFVKRVQFDQSGELLLACMGASFEELLVSSLEKLVSLNPPQRALDLALMHATLQAPDKSFRDGWDKAFITLVGHGANPFVRVEKQESEGLYVLLDTVAITVAKEAGRLRGRGADYLHAMVNACSAHALLSLGVPDRPFAGMWVGGGGDMEALVKALESADGEGCDWRSGDPYGVFSSALRLGCLDRSNPLFVALEKPPNQSASPVASSRIVKVIDQAFRVSMRGQTQGDDGLDDIFSELLSGEKKVDEWTSSYAQHRDFWAACASSLAPLFEDPGAWRQSCAMIQGALDRTQKATVEEADAVLHAIALANQTSTPARLSRNARL